MAAGHVAELRYTWDLESLPPLSPIYSTFLSGFFFLWCSSGYQHPLLAFSIFIPPFLQSINLKSALTYAMRLICLETRKRVQKNEKIHVHNSTSSSSNACFSSLHHHLLLLLFTFSVVVSTRFPCGGSDMALRDTAVPRVPRQTSLSPPHFETQRTGLQILTA